LFYDDTFGSGWSSSTITNKSLSSINSTTAAPNPFGGVGGASDTYREESHTLVQQSGAPTLAAARWFNQLLGATYDPSCTGCAINSIDASYYLLNINNNVPNFVNGIAGFGVALSQADPSNSLLTRYYIAYFGDIGGSSWTAYNHPGLTESSFIEMLDSGAYPHADFNAHPNFSGGSQIQFGYAVVNGISGSFASTNGIDNWSVQLNTSGVPEPGTFAMAGAALALLALRHRMLRRTQEPTV